MFSALLMLLSSWQVLATPSSLTVDKDGNVKRYEEITLPQPQFITEDKNIFLSTNKFVSTDGPCNVPAMYAFTQEDEDGHIKHLKYFYLELGPEDTSEYIHNHVYSCQGDIWIIIDKYTEDAQRDYSETHIGED